MQIIQYYCTCMYSTYLSNGALILPQTMQSLCKIDAL